jgi:two-component system, sensor histidine kinase LadS
MRFFRIIILLISFCGVWTSLVGQSPLLFKNADSLVNVGKNVFFLIDPSGKLDLNDILQPEINRQFQKSKDWVPNFGNTQSAIWAKLILRNETGLDIFLEIANPFLENIQFYNLSAYHLLRAHKQAGFQYPFPRRDIQVNHFVFMLNVASEKELVCYFRFQGNYPMQLPLHIGSIKPFTQQFNQIYLIEGFIYGFMWLIASFNIILYLSIRERSYLYYVLFILSTILTTATLKGSAFQYLWPNYPWFNQFLPSISGFTFVFAILFSIEFLNTRQNLMRFFHRVLYGFIGLYGLALVINVVWGNPIIVVAYVQVLCVLVAIYLMITGIIIAAKGYRPALFYFWAWVAWMLGVVVYTGQIEGVFAYNFWTKNAFQFGALCESILLSFALIDKINLFRQQVQKTQAELLVSWQEREKLVKEQNQQLEKGIAERSTQLLEAHYQTKLAFQEIKLQKEEIEAQKEEIETQRDALAFKNNEIEAQKNNLAEKNQIIEQKNHDITSSISYAKRIQEATLPKYLEVQAVFPNSFVFFRPRDIVSGDFYWLASQNLPHEPTIGKKLIAAVDCTGHGVPGALMSMIGNELLNEIVNLREIWTAHTILKELDKGIQATLKQEQTENTDGMDIALCVIDPIKQVLEFSGAKNPLIYIQNNEMHVIKSNKRGIGGFQNLQANQFESFTLDISIPTTFYLFSDGYQDQFGGPQGKKFMTTHFRELLWSIYDKPMDIQRQILKQTLIDWQADEHLQTDDILVIGVKLEAEKP